MGLAASQARFLQLTARRSDIEYQAQQICQQRLALASDTEAVSNVYNEKMSNRKMVFSYNSGDGTKEITVSYQNYKNIMNNASVGNSQAEMFLVSSSGNKLIVASEEDRDAMIKKYSENGTISFTEDDFVIADDLEDVDNFQSAIQDGIYYFAQLCTDGTDGEAYFKKESWDTIGAGAISEVYDTADDAEAQATYETKTAEIEKEDKLLELELNRLESERSAINTEIESISKVIQNNVEKTFGTFG